MKRTLTNLLYWKAAIMRAVLYALMTGGTTWIAGTDGYTTEAWENLTRFEISRLIVMSVCATVGALVAFLDKTLTKLEPEVELPVPTTNEKG